MSVVVTTDGGHTWTTAGMGTIEAIDSDNSELSVRFPGSETGPGAGAADGRSVIYGWVFCAVR